MKRLVLAVLLALGAARADAAPITWTFAATLSVACTHTGFPECSSDMLPYVPLDGTSVHGWLTFDSNAPDLSPSPDIGVYKIAKWTLDVPALDTTWIAEVGSIEVGTLTTPTLGSFSCFGCLAAFGYFSENGNTNAPLAPGPGSQLPFQFLALQQPFATDALPAHLTSFQTVGGFFVGANQITALPFTVQAVPEPGTVLLVCAGAALALARRARRRPQRPSGVPD